MLGPEARITSSSEALLSLPLAWLAEIEAWPTPFTGWSRLGTFLVPFLALAAAPLLTRRPRLAVVLALAAMADQLGSVRKKGAPVSRGLPS